MDTILIVDDTTIIRELIQATLQNHGYNAVAAGSAHQALRAMDEQPPNLILLDLIMPDMDGFTFLRIIRRNPQYRDVPVLLLTALAGREEVVQARKLGVNGYLLKSQFCLTNMMSRIEELLGRNGHPEPPKTRPACESSVTVPEATLAVTSGAVQARAVSGGRLNHHCPANAATAVIDRPARAGSAASFPPLGMTAAASKVQALSDLEPLISKEELIRLVNEGLKLRPLAPVVQKVMATTSNPSCSSEDVARAVSQDQALSIRILKLSNSSIYTRGHPVDNIKGAVGRLGSCEIRNLVMALGVLQQYEGRIADYIDARLFWEHSIACGLIASALGNEVGLESQDNLFLWGLLHDMGRLVLIEHAAEKYAQVWDKANALGLPLEAVEAKMLILDHCSILDRALEHWKFPREFIAPVVNHHKSATSIKRLGPAHIRSAAIVALADRAAHAFLLGSSGNDVVNSLDELADLAGIPPDFLSTIQPTIETQTNDLKCSMLLRTSTSPWPERLSDLRARLPKTLHPLCVSDSAHDPFQILLNRIAESDAERPNLAVVYMPDCRKQIQILGQVAAREAEAECGRLPTLLIYDKGQPDTAALANRHTVCLRMPVRVEDLVQSLEYLVEALSA